MFLYYFDFFLELQRSLTSFVQQKMVEFNNETYTQIYNNLQVVPDYNKSLAKEWAKAYSLKQTDQGNSKSKNDNSWSDIYHALIHSPALENLLQLEHSYTIAMKELTKQRDEDLKKLRDK